MKVATVTNVLDQCLDTPVNSRSHGDASCGPSTPAQSELDSPLGHSRPTMRPVDVPGYPLAAFMDGFLFDDVVAQTFPREAVARPVGGGVRTSSRRAPAG